ncbi:ferredoxin [Actinokineospora sp. NBRC 105648]|uniref:ferredoxin n=1 Tax=Actinokineospora sp. NBRC 105648 TaxID=3032206 RepID=UPI0024A28D9A|nr:ferredoxin [Actinokineospora sp. NBRC 105648]GLZ39708.1 ferredoxin [Actinokineospora sp. NBRC 105648]
MRITLEQDRCVGAGQCALTAPEVFDQSEDDGTVVLLRATPAAEQEADVEVAVALCPAQVISTHS